MTDATQAKLALVGGCGVLSAEDLEFMQFGTLKMILLEQVGSGLRVSEVERECVSERVGGGGGGTEGGRGISNGLGDPPYVVE